jgi:predicted acylesterase/phospholipase RssA
MKVGFSLSPGGLLLPYHLGALEALKYNQFLDISTALAGSSAGAMYVSFLLCRQNLFVSFLKQLLFFFSLP